MDDYNWIWSLIVIPLLISIAAAVVIRAGERLLWPWIGRKGTEIRGRLEANETKRLRRLRTLVDDPVKRDAELHAHLLTVVSLCMATLGLIVVSGFLLLEKDLYEAGVIVTTRSEGSRFLLMASGSVLFLLAFLSSLRAIWAYLETTERLRNFREYERAFIKRFGALPEGYVPVEGD